MNKIDKAILDILSDAMGSTKQWYYERNLVAGYHTININGRKYKGQRDIDERLKKLDYDFTDKKVLDIGCSSGGVLLAISKEIKIGYGLDFAQKYINAANALKAVNNIHNVHFYSFDLDKDNHELISSLVLGEEIDICFFMNLALWVKKWKEAFQYCASISKVIIFEAHGNEQQKQEQISFIKSVFEEVEVISTSSDDDPTYSSREMFLCSGLKVAKPTKSKAKTEISINTKLVEQICYEHLKLESIPEIKMNLPSSESTIAEINKEYIVKFPKTHRGKGRNFQEKALTDFLSDKTNIKIPKSNAATQNNIEFLWYKKISGQQLDGKTYSSLDENTQNEIASKLAQFMHCLHSIDHSELKGIKLKPSWEINQEDFLVSREVLDGDVLKIVIEAQDSYKHNNIEEQDIVFGHFDLHYGNVLFDVENSSLGIIDFGNCKMGDLHQDFCMLTLCSPLFSEKVIGYYTKLSGRLLSASKIRNFTILYIQTVLARYQKSGNLKELQRWKKYLLEFCQLSNNTPPPENSNTTIKNKVMLSADWEAWIFKCLIENHKHENLLPIMVEKGLDRVAAQAALAEVQSSPYMSVTRKYQEKLHKREWLLNTLDSMRRNDESYTKPKKVPLPPFQDFLRDYYYQNKIGIFTGAIDHWGTAKWTFPDLVKKVGYDSMVEVQSGREKSPDYESDRRKHTTQMKFGEFIDKITSTESSNDIYLTANNHSFKNPNLAKLLTDIDDIGDGYFETDKFKEGSFLWLGPKGVITPFHHDLTNNFFIQIKGKKKYHLIPAMQATQMYDSHYVYSDVNLLKLDLEKFPEFAKNTIIEVDLEPGECLFIPIGCWHHVIGLTENISMTLTNMKVNNYFPGHTL